ncbi:dirigent protein 25-like [Coffea eugenioides]|uniref:dirigent protein 25-like n=1 Tax=Coffea eugenioides TaxID=49369 RepID=UPI000F605773|nr:dirigent protein 25-like [Coffea eugenioides]
MAMVNHPSSVTIAWFLLFLTIIHQSFSARTLGNSSQGNGDHHANLAISFSMPDALSQKHPSSRPVTTKVNGQIPFSKPLGFFPPIGGIPLANIDTIPMTGLPSQTIDLEGISMSFPAIATLQELELGTVTTINEDIYEGFVFGSSLLGKAQGISVASSEDGSSHMMAMTASFIVIGGTGKYQNANGFATVKTVNISSSLKGEESEEAYKLLLFNVYLG